MKPNTQRELWRWAGGLLSVLFCISIILAPYKVLGFVMISVLVIVSFILGYMFIGDLQD